MPNWAARMETPKWGPRRPQLVFPLLVFINWTHFSSFLKVERSFIVYRTQIPSWEVTAKETKFRYVQNFLRSNSGFVTDSYCLLPIPPPLQFLSVSTFLIGNTMWSPNTINDWSLWVYDVPQPHMLTNLHATQPHTERTQAVTWTWISEPNLVAVFLSSVPWSSSSSSRCRRRLILSSVKHYKRTTKKKKKSFKFWSPWKGNYT